jgi:hypothetical protein
MHALTDRQAQDLLELVRYTVWAFNVTEARFARRSVEIERLE